MRATPRIVRTRLDKLRPTQMTVGLAEVEQKRRDWGEVAKDDRDRFLENHAFPAVRGPGTRFFITDHHHLGRALLEEDVETVFVSFTRDLSNLALDEFWVVLDHLQLAHPYDADGVRQPFTDMPRKLPKLADDPYRSLSAEVRRAGGYAKETAPFSEFLWADYFRRRIPATLLSETPKAALAQALDLSHRPEAEHLPGWSGAHDST
ncbi:MAG: ParB-like protein [Janthinobacterium lividum]